MKYVFVSQPINGKTDDEVFLERESAIAKIREKTGEEIIVLDSFILEDAPENSNVGLWYLGKSIAILAEADLAYFVKGWNEARGCVIEHECAEKYGIEIIEE